MNLFERSRMYSRVQKVIQFGSNKKGITFYRLRLRHSDEIVWREYHGAFAKFECGDTYWTGTITTYPGLDEYLKKQDLAWMGPSYVHPEFRGKVVSEVVRKILIEQERDFGEPEPDSPISLWHEPFTGPYWRRVLKLRPSGEDLIFYPVVKDTVCTEFRIDIDRITCIQHLLDLVYNKLFAGRLRQGGYEKSWKLFDLDSGLPVTMPGDDRKDSLGDAGIVAGSKWAVVQL